MNEDKKHPVKFTIPYPENPSRGLALATVLFAIPKLILLIPHAIVLYVLQFVLLLIVLAAQFVVLFTGKYPKELYRFVHGIIQWKLRVTSYLVGLTDEYPPFTFK